jgi:hypothetical protein
MSKKSAGGSKSSSSSGKGKKGTIEIDPSIVRFTHARIRPYFTGCGKKIEDTIKEIVDGVTQITDLPLITVIENDGEYYSLNNRRLYTIKRIQSLGLLKNNTVSVYLKPALDREKKRYVPERCALQAKVMLEHEHAAEGEEGDSPAGSDTETLATDKKQGEIEQSADVVLDVAEGVKDIKLGEGKKASTKSKQKTTTESEVPALSADKPTAKTGTKNSVALPSEVSKELKELGKLVVKGKTKAVMSQVDEWEIAGLINDGQREFILHSIGL